MKEVLFYSEQLLWIIDVAIAADFYRARSDSNLMYTSCNLLAMFWHSFFFRN